VEVANRQLHRAGTPIVRSALGEALRKAILAFSAVAAAKTWFSSGFEINNIPSLISSAHPCTDGNAE
jgi:hypothetical protein